MKKLILIIALSIFVITAGCVTKLKIDNNTSYDLDLISWVDDDGTAYWFGNDLVWDYVLDEYLEGMHPGSSDEQDVNPGNSPIYFWFALGGPEYRTEEFIKVEKRKKESYTITDTTVVMPAGVTSMKTYSLSKVANLTHIMTTDDYNDRYGAYMRTKGK